MATILILYGTKEGHTATIAERMRESIVARGHDVAVERAGERPLELSPAVDGIIVGASVHAGKHQAAVREFAKRNRERLAVMPSAFFQVCLTAADASPEADAATRQMLDEFVEETGWKPATVATFAGMLAWTQYDPFTRLLMKLVLRKRPLSPEERDTSHDIDYTDYGAVKRFAEEFADSVEG